MIRFVRVNVGRTTVHATVKEINVAEEIVDERRRRAIVNFVGRADWPIWPSFITATRSATSSASS